MSEIDKVEVRKRNKELKEQRIRCHIDNSYQFYTVDLHHRLIQEISFYSYHSRAEEAYSIQINLTAIEERRMKEKRNDAN